ncbi:unnamed protein product [Rotaria sp. Silwood2]|nr:unnamed protein product [Rotaria sp. Silwood2]
MNLSSIQLFILSLLVLILLLLYNANGKSQSEECEPGMCRSKWGFCGTGPEYCDNTDPQSEQQNQGEECPPGMCRSKWGFCGIGPEYCEEKHDSSNPTAKLQTTRNECPPGMCRSKWGYCGTGPEYCEGSHDSSNFVAKPQSTQKNQGEECPPGMCRSKWGYCGTGPEYCEAKHDSSNFTAKTQPTNGTFIGEGTLYSVSVGYTVCGTMHNDNEYIAALNAVQFDPPSPNDTRHKNSLCNKLAHVHGPNGSVTVKILDKCRECRYGDLALSKATFKKVIGAIGVNRTKIKWNWL